MKQETPPWLLAKVDQRLALMEHEIGKVTGERPNFTGYSLVMTSVTEPDEDVTPEQFEIWDKSCDNCGRYCPTTLWTGHVTRFTWDVQVILTFGVCPQCKAKWPDGGEG